VIEWRNIKHYCTSPNGLFTLKIKSVASLLNLVLSPNEFGKSAFVSITAVAVAGVPT